MCSNTNSGGFRHSSEKCLIFDFIDINYNSWYMPISFPDCVLHPYKQICLGILGMKKLTKKLGNQSPTTFGC